MKTNIALVVTSLPVKGDMEIQCGGAWWALTSGGALCACDPTVYPVAANATSTGSDADQPFRYRPYADAFGVDTFTFLVRGFSGAYAAMADSAAGTFTVNVTAVNDAPDVSGAALLVASEALYTAAEASVVTASTSSTSSSSSSSSSSSNATSYVALVFNASDTRDGETAMWINVTAPGAGSLYSAVDADTPGAVYATSLVVATGGGWAVVAMDPVAAAADAAATSSSSYFTKTLYYVAEAGRRGLPMDAVRWRAVDGGGSSSAAAGVHIIGVSCPPGYSVNVSNPGLSPVSGGAWNDPKALAGKYNLTSTSAITLAAGSCVACSAGKFSPLVDSTTCSDCAAGTFSGAGAGECAACPLHSYSDAAGSAACTACPANRGGDRAATSITLNLASQSRTACVCAGAVGLCKLNPVVTHRLKTPGLVSTLEPQK
jgi:hypothetical protein